MPSSSATLSKSSNISCSSSCTNSNNNNNNNTTKKRPFLFLTNLLRRKKVLEIDDIIYDREMNQRARSEPSVISYSCTGMGAPKTSAVAISTLTLTPGRCRDIDQDMQALRLSRQDNPFIQKVLASRESLVDTLEESVSDDAILMSQEFNSELDSDPFTLPEVQEHMIRSPPPTSWPRSPHFSIFNFPQENCLTVSSHSSEESSSHATISFNNSNRLNDFFSPSHSQVNTQTVVDVNQVTKPKNGMLYKEHKSTALPRPHSSHHSGSPQSILPRPLSHCDGPLSVRNFK